MVRKKLKKAPTRSGTNITHNDVTGIVCSWLKGLDLVGHDLIPSVPTDLDIFSLVPLSGETSAFAQARGLQALRAGVAAKTVESAEDLRLIFLVSLLLFMHPETSHLRKAVKSLLAATENALNEQQGGSSEAGRMVELIAARFAARSWDMHSSGAPAAPPQEEAAGGVRTAASLQWLTDLPAGKRVLLAGENGAIFLRFVAVLDAVLWVQALAIEDWRTHRLGTGQRGPGQRQAAELADLGSSMDNCSEILKATASLMSLTTEWDANRLVGGESTLQRMLMSCLLLLSVPTVHREAATHASTVLVHLALASWRAGGRWPSSFFFSSTEAAPAVPAAATPGRAVGSESHSSVPEQARGATQPLAGAAVMVSQSFFAARQGRRAVADDAADGTAAIVAQFMPLPPISSLAVCRALLHILHPRVLLAGLGAKEESAEGCPFAMVAEDMRCEGSVDLGGTTVERGATRRESLMLGPILRMILRHGGSSSGLSLRFLALQILEAWCNKANAFAESGLHLGMGPSDSSVKSQLDPQDGHGDGMLLLRQSLSQVMDLTMSALVHPAKLISSMAPVLLEHVFTLRRLIPDGKDDGKAGLSEPERLVGRVLEQPATSKGKYVALAVLLPRVGALRALELCPSLVEQLVWAVGVRGNVSGPAVSLLLQFLKAMGAERSAVVNVPAPAAVRDVAADGFEEQGLPEQKNGATLSTSGSGGSGLALCRLSWVAAAAAALMQEDFWSRSHVAAYLLPEVFKLDPGSVGHLFLALRSCCREGEEGESLSETTLSPGNLEAEAVEPGVRRMWAMIEVARFARKCGAAGDLSVIADSAGGTQDGAAPGLLQLEEVKWAALHVDENLRMSALSLLCTDARVTTVPAPAETQLLREVLPYSLKVFGAQSRQLLLRAMQTLFTRFRETTRVCAKGVPAAPAKAAAAGACKRQKNHGQRPQGSKNAEGGTYEGAKCAGEKEAVVPAETPSQTIARVEAFMCWLCQEVLRSLYPGCPFEREVVGLELVQLVLSELLPIVEMDGTTQTKATLSKVVSSSLFCRHWVDTLLALLGSSWDRSRGLAYSILTRFPRPLTGYEGLDGAACLATQGLHLSNSGRQRESDRGALVLRLVFGCYARGLGLRVPLLTTEVRAMHRARGGADGLACGGTEGGDASAGFLEELCGVLTHRLDGMQHSFDTLLGHQTGEGPVEASGKVSLPHGILLAAHHVLLDSKVPEETGRSSAAEGRNRRGAKPRRRAGDAPTGGAAAVVQWERRRKVAGLLLEQAFRALRLSLLIVGEHGGDEDDSRDEDDSDVEEDNTIAVRNPSSASSKAKDKSRSSISVNANGHMGVVSLDSCKPGASSVPAARGGGGSVETGESTADNIEAKDGCNTPKDVGNLEACHSGKARRHADASQRSAMEGQRAVVGAWLLAKEACRFLATIVSASPLPSGEDGKGVSTDRVGAQGRPEPLSPTEKGAPSAASGGVKTVLAGSGSLLAQEDVTAIGETLLKTLLSLKHMGCVASAQAALQAVCEALLINGRRNTYLIGLPSIWMDQLLRQLSGEKQEFVLRRSAGLALAFMAILRAEPRSVDPVLLPRCMRQLLAIAMTKADKAGSNAYQLGVPESNCTNQVAPAAEQATVSAGSSGDWKSTVHALNVLRLVFVDATLGDDVGTYVTEATTAAVCGFENSVWAVRNSSMMLFASIMQRAVGGAKNVGPLSPHTHSDASRRPHAARGAVTAEAFFQQHSMLHPFLLSELERATDHTAEARAGPGVSRVEMHPVLYPILLLLARLKAGGGSNGMEAEQAEGSRVGQVAATPTAAFVPLVIRCASNPHLLARVASARALAALVPPTEAQDVIIELLSRLPKNEADTTIAMPAGTSAHNYMHGTLLKVSELLLAIRASTSGGDGQLSETTNNSTWMSKSQAQVESAVLRLLWLADPTKSRCPLVRHAMLQVLEVLGGLKTDATRESNLSSVQSALRSAEELNFSHEATSRMGSANGRALPGRSVLVSAVAAAVIRRRLEEFTPDRGTSRRVYAASGASINAGSKAGPSSSACIVEKNINPMVEEPIRAEQLQLVADMLSSSDVDIRDAAIKATKKAFGAAGNLRKVGDVSSSASLSVWASAATALMAETHPPNIRRLVRLLSRVGVHLRGCCLPSAMINQLWEHLRGLYEGGSEDVRAGALEVMGVVMRLGEAPTTEDENGPSFSTLRFDEYTSLLEGGVGSAQPVATRAAVATSLASSGLLLKTASTAAVSITTSAPANLSTAAGARVTGVNVNRKQDEVSVDRGVGTSTRLWFVALSLLQDDDESVRNCASRACATATDHGSSTTAGARGSAGGRVDLCAVDRVLSHLAAIAESDGGACAAEHFVLNLVRALDGTPKTTNTPADTGLIGVGVTSHGRFEMEDEGIGENEDEDMIFGHEQRKQFQEPTVFARVAAPYLCRALLALDARGGSAVFPEAVLLGLARVLGSLSDKLEELDDPRSATWHPGVYGRMTTMEFSKEEMEWRKNVDQELLSRARIELTNLDSKGPYDAKQLGKLVSLDEAVQATDDYAPKKLAVQLLLHDRALASMSKGTVETLKTSKGSSSLAFELLRRDLTEVNALAKALYASTEEQRREDDGLRRHYIAFSPILELDGALVTSGIDVEEWDWAKTLIKNLPNLKRLRSTPWHEVALLLKLITMAPDVGGEAPSDDGGVQDKKDTLATATMASTSLTDRPWKNPPTRAEIRIIEELYSVGEGAPAIRQQVLDARLGLDVADELEDMGIYDATEFTLEDIRILVGRATTQLEQEEAAGAKEAAKAAGEAEVERRPFAGSSRARRRCGEGRSYRCKAPSLRRKAAPKLTKLTKLIKWRGGSQPSIIHENTRLQATMNSVREELERVSIEDRSDEGIKRALEAVEKATAAIAPPEGWGQNRIAANAVEAAQSSLQSQRLTLGDGNYGKGGTSNETSFEKVEQETLKQLEERETRFPGRYFYSTITVSSQMQAKTAAMMQAASEAPSTLKQDSKTTEVGGSAGILGIGATASTSFGNATSVGTTTVNTTAVGASEATKSLSARYQQHVRCTGPRAPTPGAFADALFNDNFSWAVTDRGLIEALVPVTRVLENTIEVMIDGADKRSLKTSVKYITAAWRMRAKLWDIFTDPDDTTNANVPPAILKLVRSASPEEQGRVQDLVWAVYGVLEFQAIEEDHLIWSDIHRLEPKSEMAGMEVAEAIRLAALAATGTSGVPSEFHYLDPEEVEAHVRRLMGEKAKVFKSIYFREKEEEDPKFALIDEDAIWAGKRPLLRFGKYDPNDDATGEGEAAFNKLMMWEKNMLEDRVSINSELINSMKGDVTVSSLAGYTEFVVGAVPFGGANMIVDTSGNGNRTGGLGVYIQPLGDLQTSIVVLRGFVKYSVERSSNKVATVDTSFGMTLEQKTSSMSAALTGFISGPSNGHPKVNLTASDADGVSYTSEFVFPEPDVITITPRVTSLVVFVEEIPGAMASRLTTKETGSSTAVVAKPSFTDLTRGGVTLAGASTVSTLPNLAGNYDTGEFLSARGRFDPTSLGATSVNHLSGVMNDLFSTGDQIDINIGGRGPTVSKFVQRGAMVAVDDSEAPVAPFTKDAGAGQAITLKLSDASNVTVSFDETTEAVTVGAVSYDAGDSLVLDGKKCTIIDI
eukprot:g16755.t1